MSIQGVLKVAIGLNIAGLLFSGWQLGLSSICSMLALGNISVLIILHVRLQQFFNSAILLSGEKTEIGSKETILENHITASTSYINEAHLAFSGINEIGQDGFTTLIQGISNEGIRTSLLSANDKITALRKKEKENNWINQGIAAISELKQKENDIAAYSFLTISTIVKYIQANQGGFFLLRDVEKDPHFELVATYAYGKKKYLEKRVNPGEGIIGQVYYEKQMIYITDVPKDYVKITSGLGEALPRCICIVPLLSEGRIHGAIEIALFHTLRPSELEYLYKIGESIGYNLGAIESHRHTELLLVESQKMAQEVKSQEEELRQNMEELTATQEHMNRKQTEMDAVLSSLSTVELDLEGNVLQANGIFLGITGYNLSDIQGKLYKSLVPQHGNDPIQYEMMWNSILSGRSFSGEFRIVNKANKEMWMAGNFTPIAGNSGLPYKVMVISLFDTQDKEKLLELQEMVMALKNCFPMAELNPDLTFKTANDLFLAEIGVKRLELKKLSSMNVLANGSFGKVEKYMSEIQEHPNNVVLSIQDKNGITKRYNSTLIKINNNTDKRKKGITDFTK